MKTMILQDNIQLLEPSEYSEKRYETFKKLWNRNPEVNNNKKEFTFNIKWHKKETIVYTSESFSHDGQTFYKLCNKPHKTFISEWIENWILMTL